MVNFRIGDLVRVVNIDGPFMMVAEDDIWGAKSKDHTYCVWFDDNYVFHTRWFPNWMLEKEKVDV